MLRMRSRMLLTMSEHLPMISGRMWRDRNKLKPLARAGLCHNILSQCHDLPNIVTVQTSRDTAARRPALDFARIRTGSKCRRYQDCCIRQHTCSSHAPCLFALEPSLLAAQPWQYSFLDSHVHSSLKTLEYPLASYPSGQSITVVGSKLELNSHIF